MVDITVGGGQKHTSLRYEHDLGGRAHMARSSMR
jgi:hypothetical protein